MQLSIREPGSALTHLTAMMLAAGSAVPLLMKAASVSNIGVVAMSIFIVSMVLLYAASTTYHSVTVAPAIIQIYRKIDHMMIFVMIAGGYTPVCLLVLERNIGIPMLILVWCVALGGALMNAVWITCPKWFSSVIYIGMGWICAAAIRPIITALSLEAFLWLLGGGILYTIGGIIYATKLKVFGGRFKNFGAHEVFHLFIMAGSFCHFIFMYQYVLG